MKSQILAVSLVILSGTGLAAHHSHGMFYDPCANVTIEGKIESIEWKNPHTLIDLKTTDEVAYRAEWTSLVNLTTMGVAGPARGALKVGERVVVSGNPGRDPDQIRASFPAFTGWVYKTVDITQIRLAGDGWNWTMANPPRCAQK